MICCGAQYDFNLLTKQHDCYTLKKFVQSHNLTEAREIHNFPKFAYFE